MFQEDGTSHDALAGIENTSAQQRIIDEMNRRRARMLAQVEAAALQSEICDWIRELKGKTPELSAKIEAADPDLRAYIQKLERINGSLWCAECDNIISIRGGALGLLQ